MNALIAASLIVAGMFIGGILEALENIRAALAPPIPFVLA